jgi:hypothetical protein
MGYHTHLSGKLIIMSENLSRDKDGDDDENLHLILTTAYLLSGNHSTMSITRHCIPLISTCICIAVSNAISGLTVKTLNSTHEVVTITLTPAGFDMHHDVKNFLLFAYTHAKLTVSEMIHLLFLIELYVKKESLTLSETHSSISKANLGSVLLCSLIVSLKMDRDVPFNNKWFGRMFAVPLDILEESEICFLKRIQFHCNLDEEKMLHFCHRYLPPQLSSPFEGR